MQRRLSRLCGALALAAGALLPLGASAQDLALMVSFRAVQVGNDGVTRTTEYRERLIRQGDNVWTERIVPESSAAEHAAEHARGHRHFDFSRAGRWLQKKADGTLRLLYADPHDRVLVDVDRTNYADVGFDGSWERARFLVDPASLAAMRVEGAPVDGAQWYTNTRPEGRTRVLWDERQRFPREVRSESADRRIRRTVTATPEPLPARMPWTRVEGFERKGYNDFLD